MHTGISLDAGLFGNTLGHEAAYRLARGEEVVSSTGLPVKLGRPLDWLVITDHSDMMGFATDLQRGASNIVADPKGREWYEGFQKGGEAAGKAAFDLISHFTQNNVPKKLLDDYTPGSPVYNRVWDKITYTADSFNEPAKFTALIGFEWTSIPKGNNLHRNVILRDDGNRARLVTPLTTQPPLGNTDPLVLYQWLANYEAKTRGQAFAIAHNGNLSNGWMFPTEETYAGGEVDQNYVRLRAKWEPVYEVTQIKGDGEAHPALSPNDEFANYETWDKANLDLSVLKKPDMLQREYAREALKQGLRLQKKLGINPYKFGMVGATDSHTSLATAEEENFFGKSTSAEPSAKRVEHPFVKSELAAWEGYQLVASGYQGVWASENTREAIFDAMLRKETYATTGPRIPVRFFGGWEFDQNDLRSRVPAFRGYEKGVPMGGDLPAATGDAATFMVYALRDPMGANLDRIQIIKGWMEADGSLKEKVYDVAWRLARFGLSLHQDKTRLVEFGRFADLNRRQRGVGKPETFDFLGLTHYCTTTLRGRFRLGRKPVAKRVNRTLARIDEVLRKRWHHDIWEVGRWLGRVCNGWLNYFAVLGSGRFIRAFLRRLQRRWMRALRRRSQRARFSWKRLERMTEILWPRASIRHPWPDQRFAVKHPR